MKKIWMKRYIKSIVPERMKIKLILIDACFHQAGKSRLTYYVDPTVTHHLSHWRYSPSLSQKCIETVFDEAI